MPEPRNTAQRLLGPAVRRARRQWQWRRCGADLSLSSSPDILTPHDVATHRTPLYRKLSGLDEELQRGKVVNLRLAVAALSGLTLRPGQRLSFWYHVGAPTQRRGFVNGLILDDGRLVAGTGGGLCQLTNLLYWMTLHTPLTVVERWRHTYDVFPDAGRTQPFGSGATCAYPSLDLQIDNCTGQTFRLDQAVTDTHLEGGWRSDLPVALGYEVYEEGHQMTNPAPGVFMRHNRLRRRTTERDGRLIEDDVIAENHALMRYQPFLPAAPSPQERQDLGPAG